MKRFIYSSLLFLMALSCQKKESLSITPPREFKTKNVVLIVMDGARYSECLGDPTRQYIPGLDSLTKNDGLVCTSFFNKGVTETVSGHTAICTGVYENMENGGRQIPFFPGIFHYYKNQCSIADNKIWIISSKDKLEILKNAHESDWADRYEPSTDCGVHGNGTGYREDSFTYEHSLSVLNQYHPSLILIQFKQPDVWGHLNNWPAYLQGIEQVDGYITTMWKYLQTDTVYKDKTTLIVTNDHGRHLDGHLDGFASHGDGCEGCSHINFFAMGPDFKKRAVITTSYELIDISKTVADMLHFRMHPYGGKVMEEIYE